VSRVAATAPVPGEVRIIGGQWKRSKLPVPARPGLRPTPDRVRETLFNWLGQDLQGWHCLDAFAGSGALGLEAASRGAATVRLVELDRTLAAALRQHVARFAASGVQVLQGDALAALRAAPPAAWDLVFLDPPFDAGRELFVQCLQAARALLRPDGRLYLEAPQAWPAAELQPLGLQLLRQGRAGQVHYHLLALWEPHSADNLQP
jgi:16S rRNA (guanine966-N2)-methyltransferase